MQLFARAKQSASIGVGCSFYSATRLNLVLMGILNNFAPMESWLSIILVCFQRHPCQSILKSRSISRCRKIRRSRRTAYPRSQMESTVAGCSSPGLLLLSRFLSSSLSVLLSIFSSVIMSPAKQTRNHPCVFRVTRPDPGAYFVHIDSARFVTISSFASTVVALLPGFVMILLSFPPGQDASRSNKGGPHCSSAHASSSDC